MKIGAISDWIYVYRRFIPDNVLKELSINLILKDNGQDREEVINLFDCDNINNPNSIVAIPRYCNYGLELISNDLLNEDRCIGEDIDIEMKSNYPPRDYQIEAIESIINNDHGIIYAKTAFGKTYTAINAISKLKKKALILMHKRDLMYQWKEDILEYTNLNEDDIQIFTGSDFKSNKKITITTVQNIIAKNRLDNMKLRELFKNENFGMTFYDECHTTIGPLANSLTSRWIFSKRIYGLSATPKRGDELDTLIKYILGDIIYEDTRKILPVYVSFAPVDIEVSSKTRYYLNFSKTLYTIRYNKWLLKQEKYINHCTNIILELIKHDKKFLVIAQLKDLLETIFRSTKDRLDSMGIDINKIRLIHGTSIDKYEDIRDIDEEELKNFNCIFTTNKFFSDGLSLKWLDSIVYLTSPSSKSKSAIPQLVGRIVRDYKDKRYVNVIDIYNRRFEIEESRKRSRVKAYESLEYSILNDFSYMENIPKYIDYVISESEKYSSYTDLLL